VPDGLVITTTTTTTTTTTAHKVGRMGITDIRYAGKLVIGWLQTFCRVSGVITITITFFITRVFSAPCTRNQTGRHYNSDRMCVA